MVRKVRAVFAAVVLVGAATVQAQGSGSVDPRAERLYARALAATCAHCHGTDGRAVEGGSSIRLAGQSREHLLRQLIDFRSGGGKATVMHQLSRGYSVEQLEKLADYFAAQK
ncbi:MAG: cytochrome C [Burkholderiales bacterium]|nr:cytochrome C [Burkholderiales bacterium]